MASGRAGKAWRRDHNQADIVDALERLGCKVVDLSGVGGGCPDLLVKDPRRDRWVMVEIKNPATRGKLNKLQEEWHEKFAGPDLFVVRSIDEAVALFTVKPSVTGI